MHGPAPAHPPHRPPAQGTVVLLRVVFVGVAVLSMGFLAWVALLRAAVVERRPLGWWLLGIDLALILGTSAVAGGLPQEDWRTDAAVAVLLAQLAAAVVRYLVVDIRAVRTAGQGNAYAPGYGYPQGAAAYPGGPPATGAAPHPYGPPQPPAPSRGPAPDGPPYGHDPRPYGRADPSYGGDGPSYGRGAQPYPPPYAADLPYARTETRPPAPPRPNGPAAPGHPYTPPQDPSGPPQDGARERPQPQRIDRVRAELDELSDYLRKEEGR